MELPHHMPCFKIILNFNHFFGSFFDPPNPQQGDAPAGRHPTGTSKDFSCDIESWNSNDTVTGRVAGRSNRLKSVDFKQLKREREVNSWIIFLFYFYKKVVLKICQITKLCYCIHCFFFEIWWFDWLAISRLVLTSVDRRNFQQSPGPRR